MKGKKKFEKIRKDDEKTEGKKMAKRRGDKVKEQGKTRTNREKTRGK